MSESDKHACSRRAERLLSQGCLNGCHVWRLAVKGPDSYVNYVAVSFCPWCGQKLRDQGQQEASQDECGRSFGGDGMPLLSSTCLRRYGHDGPCFPQGMMPGVSEEVHRERADKLDVEAQQKGLT